MPAEVAVALRHRGDGALDRFPNRMPGLARGRGAASGRYGRTQTACARARVI
jgi:hypothetical protein